MTGTARVPLPHGVHTVDLVVPDLVGSLRGKKVPAARWDHVSEHGVAIANAIFVWTARCNLDRPVRYANMATGFPDVEIVPDLTTLRALPWRPGTAMVICDTKEADGSPCVMAPRQVLRSVIDRATAMGYAPSIGFEVEFYLLDPDTLLSRDSGIQCYSPLRGNEYEHVIAPIRNHLTDIGMVVEASNSEYGPGQFEINIRFDDALTTADNAVLFRHAVRDIAAQHGLLATFMAKPFGLESGCGMHIHQSLWKDGVNIFANGGSCPTSAAGTSVASKRTCGPRPCWDRPRRTPCAAASPTRSAPSPTPGGSTTGPSGCGSSTAPTKPCGSSSAMAPRTATRTW